MVPQGASGCLIVPEAEVPMWTGREIRGWSEEYVFGESAGTALRCLGTWGTGVLFFCSMFNINFFLDSASVGIRCTTALYAGIFLSPHWQDQFTSTVLCTVVIGLNKSYMHRAQTVSVRVNP